MEKILIEKQVWESTLHRSMVLQAENEQLRELLKECLEPLEVLADKRNACDWYPEDLLAKIDEVLK